jgi:hypothetical protein
MQMLGVKKLNQYRNMCIAKLPWWQQISGATLYSELWYALLGAHLELGTTLLRQTTHEARMAVTTTDSSHWYSMVVTA